MFVDVIIFQIDCFSAASTDQVDIENIDRAIATVSKLVVGKYQFRLTVKDVEGLEGSSVVTITVKESMQPFIS